MYRSVFEDLASAGRGSYKGKCLSCVGIEMSGVLPHVLCETAHHWSNDRIYAKGTLADQTEFTDCASKFASRQGHCLTRAVESVETFLEKAS